MNILKVKKKKSAISFAMAFPKEKIICPAIKWAYFAKKLHNESDLKDSKRETMTIQEVLSKSLEFNWDRKN